MNYDHRKGTKTINLGKEYANKQVTVKQTQHQFLFGCSEFSVAQYANGEMDAYEAIAAQKRYKHMMELFNNVTLSFYWGEYEPEQGNRKMQRMKNAAQWLKDRNIKVKGHPMCWHSYSGDWLMELTNEEVYNILIDRVATDADFFSELIDIWDVVNEPVIMPLYRRYDNAITRLCKERGRVSLISDLFSTARKANPKATLLINDFDIRKYYNNVLDDLLDAGAEIDAIGIQSHMHDGFWGVEKTQEILHKYSKYNLPIHFTEVSLVSGDLMPSGISDKNDYQPKGWLSHEDGEMRQAEEAVELYKTLFSHPLVQSITWWELKDGLWLNAPSGVLDVDDNPKPSYKALYQLIKEDWWTEEEYVIVDDQGIIKITGFLGGYLISCDGREWRVRI